MNLLLIRNKARIFIDFKEREFAVKEKLETRPYRMPARQNHSGSVRSGGLSSAFAKASDGQAGGEMRRAP